MYVVTVLDEDSGESMTFTCRSVFKIGSCVDSFIQFVSGDSSDKRILKRCTIDVLYAEEINE